MVANSCGLRALIISLTAAVSTLAIAGAAESPRGAPGKEGSDGALVRSAFLRSTCLKCHADRSDDLGGGVRLDSLSPDIAADIATADLWQKVFRVVNAGEMPPEDEPRPEPAALEAFLESLSLGLVDARRRLADGGTASSLRRLNRREYARTIRALVGLEPDVSNLPNDQGTGGYDTAGAALTISSDQYEAYLATARSVLREWCALCDSRQVSDGSLKIHKDVSSLDLVKTLKDGEREFERHITRLGDAEISGPSGSVSRNRHVEFLAHTVASLRQPSPERYGYVAFRTARSEESISLPSSWPSGRYRLRVQCAAVPHAARSQRFLEIGQPVDEFTILGCHEVLGSPEAPQVIEHEFILHPGGNRVIAVRERRHNSKLHALDHYYGHLHASGIGPTPVIGIDWMEVEGPLPEDGRGDPALEVLLSTRPAVEEAAFRDELTAFATRAFRGRMPSEPFIDKLISIRRAQLENGVPLTEATIETLAVILSSPAFLYLVEPAGEDGASRMLSDREVAVRLAYFLTSSPPDAELLTAAAAKTLTQPGRMIAHADRLIAGDATEAFVAGFVYQWLDLERLAFFQFDPKLYWEFDDSTREASKQEIYRFFTRLLRENLPVREFLDSEWTVANGLLASYYGWDGIHGEDWQVVRVPKQSHRGGLLGMAAVLAMGSNGVRTSPVERGAWVLRKLVDEPPPDAPANVPQLTRLDGQALSPRDRLKAHQESPQCFHCHKKIDPIGFGLENFDAVGRWRDEDVQTVGRKGPHVWPIDPSGTFIDGRTFATLDELKALIASREEIFARSVIAELFQYAIGRPLSIADDPVVDNILAQTKPAGFRLRDIIHAIIATEAFRTI